jgi:transcriptional regulator with XRE-family HTH domain
MDEHAEDTEQAPSAKQAFGKRLKAARTNRKLTQAKVGELLGVNKVTVSSWELGHNFPDPLMLGQIAKLYDVTIDLLVWDDGISMEAIQFAVQYDQLNDSLKRKFSAMWMAYFQQAVSDGEVEAQIDRGTGRVIRDQPMSSSEQADAGRPQRERSQL